MARSAEDRAAGAATIPRPMPTRPMPTVPAQHKPSHEPKLRAPRCSIARIRRLGARDAAQALPEPARMLLACRHTVFIVVTLAVFQLPTFWLNADAE